MRLIHTSKLELAEFLVDVPAYAILSHTWSNDEVLFQDFASTRDAGATNQKDGWKKVLGACELSRALGYDWIWIDTCCIDKTSSAELSEAINSMFKWYSNAAVCIAYLADVPIVDMEGITTAVVNSRWFTRGWTLQELLAPLRLDFYSTEWAHLGSRSYFAAAIEMKTHIDAKFLLDRSIRLSTASVAERMCWASGRQTTRTEDQAYSLLGIFDVNIPLIYGEGTKAFKRLQEAILRETDEQSIFAWGAPPVEGVPPVLSTLELSRSLLADSPSRFAFSGDIVPFSTPGLRAGLSLEHNGIVIPTPLWKQRRLSRAGLSGGLFLAPRGAWRTSNLCDVFVYFDRPPGLDGMTVVGDAEDPLSRGCIVRSLPPGYQAIEAFSVAEGYREISGLFPYTKRVSDAYGLAVPVLLRLRPRLGPPDRPGQKASRVQQMFDLALVLQFQYLSFQIEGNLHFPSEPEWMINRVVRIPSGKTLEYVAQLVMEESSRQGAAVQFDLEESGGECAASSTRSKDYELLGRPGPSGFIQELYYSSEGAAMLRQVTSSLMNATWGGLEIRDEFMLTVAVEPAYGPGVFVVDVADSDGRGVSKSASALDDEFERVRK